LLIHPFPSVVVIVGVVYLQPFYLFFVYRILGLAL
jgi:hypothetical protein